MPNFALVRNDVVENIIVAEKDWVAEYAKDHGFEAVDVSKVKGPVGPGYTKKGNVFLPPEETEPEQT